MAEYSLYVTKSKHQITVALLDAGKLIELQHFDSNRSFAVGDIYLGQVKKKNASLNAAFVDIGHHKEGFLHYHDLGKQTKTVDRYVSQTLKGKVVTSSLDKLTYLDEIEKAGHINDVIRDKHKILTQIVKEPISSKGPRLAGEISIAGRYLVLLPFSKKVSISQKIKETDERKRLSKIMSDILPKNFGVIIRTVAKDCTLEQIDGDLKVLLKKWDKLHKKLKRAQMPSLVSAEMSRVTLFLRDMFNKDFQRIVVDDADLYEEMSEYLNVIAPKKASILKHHTAKLPVFEKYDVTRQIKSSFGRIVPMVRGTYLVIEHTEALHVIDVNSGNRVINKESQEENILEVNKVAATEIARQLRLRDMGGIIVVDFIDMANADHRKELFNHLKEEMKADKAKHKILPPSRFGLIQITRQRTRPELNIDTKEECPNGTGNLVRPPIQIIQEIQSKFELLLQDTKVKGSLYVNVHPFVHAYLTRGMRSIRFKWFLKYKKWLHVQPYHSHKFLEFQFVDKKGKKLI